jgi:hypothetical protein
MTAVTTKGAQIQNDGPDYGSQLATSLNADFRKAELKQWLCYFRASVLALLSESARSDYAGTGQDYRRRSRQRICSRLSGLRSMQELSTSPGFPLRVKPVCTSCEEWFVICNLAVEPDAR